MSRPFVIGVAGGTGSGKSTVAERLRAVVGREALALVQLDSYYCAQPAVPFEQRAQANYDHPSSFDWPLLLAHVRDLLAGRGVDEPDYDFTRHDRSAATRRVEPAQIVVVEGIFALYEPDLLGCYDLKVFVDADADVRFIRRLRRDLVERGRTVDSVIAQYLETVRPMHLQFVEPTKRHADVIIPRGGHNDPALDMLAARVASAV
ncbi:MAG: uridine kinase [Acidimicrobiales bacterium]